MHAMLALSGFQHAIPTTKVLDWRLHGVLGDGDSDGGGDNNDGATSGGDRNGGEGGEEGVKAVGGCWRSTGCVSIEVSLNSTPSTIKAMVAEKLAEMRREAEEALLEEGGTISINGDGGAGSPLVLDNVTLPSPDGLRLHEMRTLKFASASDGASAHYDWHLYQEIGGDADADATDACSGSSDPTVGGKEQAAGSAARRTTLKGLNLEYSRHADRITLLAWDGASVNGAPYQVMMRSDLI
jgi:hypothetical protein